MGHGVQVASPPPLHDLQRSRLTQTSASSPAGGWPATTATDAKLRLMEPSKHQRQDHTSGAAHVNGTTTDAPEGTVGHFTRPSSGCKSIRPSLLKTTRVNLYFHVSFCLFLFCLMTPVVRPIRQGMAQRALTRRLLLQAGMQGGVQHFDADSKSISGGAATFSVVPHAPPLEGVYRPHAHSGDASHLFGAAFQPGSQLHQPHSGLGGGSNNGAPSNGTPEQPLPGMHGGLNGIGSGGGPLSQQQHFGAMHSGSLRSATQPTLPPPSLQQPGHASGAHPLFGNGIGQQRRPQQDVTLQAPFNGISDPSQQQQQQLQQTAAGPFGTAQPQFGATSGGAPQFGAAAAANQFEGEGGGAPGAQPGEATANLNMGLQSLSQAGNIASQQVGGPAVMQAQSGPQAATQRSDHGQPPDTCFIQHLLDACMVILGRGEVRCHPRPHQLAPELCAVFHNTPVSSQSAMSEPGGDARRGPPAAAP